MQVLGLSGYQTCTPGRVRMTDMSRQPMQESGTDSKQIKDGRFLLDACIAKRSNKRCDICLVCHV